MRVLATCSLGGAGHLRPMLPLLHAAVASGDEVVLVAPEGLRDMAADLAGRFVAIGQPPEEVIAPIRAQLPTLPAADASRLGESELFGRLATRAAMAAVEGAAVQLDPDLVVRDPCEHAGAVVAVRRGCALLTVGISQAAAEWGALDLSGPVVDLVEPGTTATVRRSAYVTAFPASLDPSPFPATVRLRHDDGPPRPLPDWWPGDSRPLVYLTMGTVLGHMDIAAAVIGSVVDAVAPLPVRVLVTTGRAVDPAAIGPQPGNVHVERWVAQADAMAAASMVVCHGGSGTVLGALAAGLPMVVVPAFADQFRNGRLVADAGAGRCVERPAAPGGERRPPGADMAERIRDAVAVTMADDSCRTAARRVAAELGASPTPADVLAQLRLGTRKS